MTQTASKFRSLSFESLLSNDICSMASPPSSLFHSTPLLTHWMQVHWEHILVIVESFVQQSLDMLRSRIPTMQYKTSGQKLVKKAEVLMYPKDDEFSGEKADLGCICHMTFVRVAV